MFGSPYSLFILHNLFISILDCPSLIFGGVFFYLTLIEVVTLSRVSKLLQNEVKQYLWTLKTLSLPRGVFNGNVLDTYVTFITYMLSYRCLTLLVGSWGSVEI